MASEYDEALAKITKEQVAAAKKAEKAEKKEANGD